MSGAMKSGVASIMQSETCVVVHMFAGERRKNDVQEYLEILMEQQGLELLMISVDLAMDADWDFSNPNN